MHLSFSTNTRFMQFQRFQSKKNFIKFFTNKQPFFQFEHPFATVLQNDWLMTAYQQVLPHQR